MLYKAEYLDVNTLDGYISTIEGGVRESETLRTVNGKDRSGKVNVGPVNGGVGSSSETESTFSFGDHQVSKLKRLIDAGHEDPESTGWVEVWSRTAPSLILDRVPCWNGSVRPIFQSSALLWQMGKR